MSGIPIAGTNQQALLVSDASSAAILSNALGTSSVTSTLTSVAASASNTLLLAADPTRQRVIFINDSTQALYGKVGGGEASIAVGGYSFVIPPKTTAPAVLNFDKAYGAHLEINGIWAAADATGFLNIVSFFS